MLCTLFDITQYDAEKARLELRAHSEGILYAHRQDRLCRPGQVLCRIAGKEPLVEPGAKLLED